MYNLALAQGGTATNVSMWPRTAFGYRFGTPLARVERGQALGGVGTRATQRTDWPNQGWTWRSMARSAGTTSRS
jgi:hypothetical protein